LIKTARHEAARSHGRTSTASSWKLVFSIMGLIGVTCQTIHRNLPSDRPGRARRDAAVNGESRVVAVSMLPSAVNFALSAVCHPGSAADGLPKTVTFWRPRLPS
jgi:hypothetical protein